MVSSLLIKSTSTKNHYIIKHGELSANRALFDTSTEFQTPGDDENIENGRGIGRIQHMKLDDAIVESVDVIQGFDFVD
ncbi:hypothetical protein L1887_30141 [Cichorium endivia]|nr:hypothetical protein L1887_30141 [Cichorium endivia]